MSSPIVDAIVVPYPPTVASVWYLQRDYADRVRRWTVHRDYDTPIPYRKPKRGQLSVVELALVLVLPDASLKADNIQLTDCADWKPVAGAATIVKRTLQPMSVKDPRAIKEFLNVHGLPREDYAVPLCHGMMFAYDVRVRLDVVAANAHSSGDFAFRVGFYESISDSLLCNIRIAAFRTQTAPEWLIVSTPRKRKRSPRASPEEESPSPYKRQRRLPITVTVPDPASEDDDDDDSNDDSYIPEDDEDSTILEVIDISPTPPLTPTLKTQPRTHILPSISPVSTPSPPALLLPWLRY